jgi:hypothetical protein
MAVLPESLGDGFEDIRTGGASRIRTVPRVAAARVLRVPALVRAAD